MKESSSKQEFYNIPNGIIIRRQETETAPKGKALQSRAVRELYCQLGETN